MSMVGCYRALSNQDLLQLEKEPECVVEFLDVVDAPGAHMGDVDKAWHAIHYLLTGRPEGGAEPASLTLLGGKEVGPDLGYGPPRLLTSEQVARVAGHLESLPPEVLGKRYDPAAMDAASIYPETWERDGEQGLSYILEWYQTLRTFYLQARARQDGALLWLG